MAEATLKESYRQLVATWDAIVPERKDALADEFLLGYAFNSGHIENGLITLHDTREVFENGRVVSFTGDIRTLFEIQNLKTSWEWGAASPPAADPRHLRRTPLEPRRATRFLQTG